LNKFVAAALIFLALFIALAILLGWKEPFTKWFEDASISAPHSDDWNLVHELDPMTDEVSTRAAKEFRDGALSIEAAASCKGKKLEIQFAFFDGDGEGINLERVAQNDLLSIFTAKDVDASMLTLMQLSEGQHGNFVMYRRRIGDNTARRVVTTPAYLNSLTDSRFKGIVFETESRLLYEFKLQGGVQTLVEIYPDSAGFSEIAYQCGHLSYRPASLGRDPALDNLPELDAEQARAKAIDILLGPPYGETKSEVDSNILTQVRKHDDYCGTNALSWEFEVSFNNELNGSTETGLLLLDATSGDMVCAGLPYLD
jgi:hypothetical protein